MNLFITNSTNNRSLLIILLIFIINYLLYFKVNFKFNSPRGLLLHNKIQKLFENFINFGDKFDVYLQIHNSIIEKSENETKKITFAIPAKGYGYGNKVYGLISALVIAIITDSAVLIDWPEAEKFIESPLKDTFKKFNTTFQLSLGYTGNTSNYHQHALSQNDWIYEKRLEYLVNKSIPNDKIRYIYADIRPMWFTLCSNPIYYKKFESYDLVQTSTLERAKEALDSTSTMSEEEKIHRLYMIGFEVGSNLFNKVWVINQKFMNEINEIYDENFKNNFVIGMQLRYDYLSDNDISKFIQCAKYIQEINEKKKNVKWFITTEHAKILKMLDDEYGHMVIQGKGKIGILSYDPNTYSRSIIDNELLGRVDEMIITGGSTYGFTSALRNQKLPYYIEGRRRNMDDNNTLVPCKRMNFARAPRTPLNYSVV
ncbi:unnamed protein product [Brachionus calyciflorus]|uniref:Uncharacterized protein n=1 Tax=Brachionus calyciflorus TaxID=104777 RepID=A0A814N8B8_9BILA|nr:unnamed protein product [Brachionus calyciflorus]